MHRSPTPEEQAARAAIEALAGKPFTDEEWREARENLRAFYALLAKWDAADGRSDGPTMRTVSVVEEKVAILVAGVLRTYRDQRETYASARVREAELNVDDPAAQKAIRNARQVAIEFGVKLGRDQAAAFRKQADEVTGLGDPAAGDVLRRGADEMDQIADEFELLREPAGHG